VQAMESDILLAPTLRARWSKSLSLSSLVGEFPKPPAECWRTSVRTPQDCGGYATLEKQKRAYCAKKASGKCA